MGLTLSKRQASTVATAVTLLSVVVILAAIGGALWLLAYFLRTFSGVFLPVAVGAVAALVCRPYYDWLTTRLKLPGPVALVAVVLSVVLPFAVFLAFFGTLLVRQSLEVLSHVPEWWKTFTEMMRSRWPELEAFLQTNTGIRIRDAFASMQEEILSGLRIFGGKAVSAGVGVVRGIGGLLGWAVLPVYFAFFLMARAAPVETAELLPFLKPETRKDVTHLVEEFLDIVVAFFRGQLIIALLQGLLFAVGFTLVGLRYGFLIGLLFGILNVIPYLGSIIGLSVSLPLAFFQGGGGFGTLIGVVAVFVIVQLIEGYVLTPRIMGERTGLHPLAIIIAIFFWGTALGGILGMILAIPLTAFLASVWRLLKEKYITELV
jgi:predicted PurR-regulated permease PerM